MTTELPRRLYGEGVEPQIKKVNNSCRISILKVLKKAVSEEYGDVKRDPVFAHIVAIHENGLKFSAKLVHSFLCKELITSKRHEKWFIFAKNPLRFSQQEFHAITGLKMSKDSGSEVVRWKPDNGFWSTLLKKGGKISLKCLKNEHLKDVHKWSRVDRLRLVYLCVVMGLLMGRDEKVHIPDLYIKLAMDLEKFRNFHWGLLSYDFLLSSIDKTRKNLGKKDSYILEGFFFAFQIWIMEAIPDFGEICGKRVSATFIGPRCGNWKGSAKVSYEDVIQLEESFTEKGKLHSFISVTGNGDVLATDEYQREDENEDERVDLLMDMIKNKFDWSTTVWEVIETVKSEIEEEEATEARDVIQVTEGVNVSAIVAEEVSMDSVTRTGKRKIHDEGAESRKKKILCQRSAEKKGSLDDATKRFIEDMFKTAFTAFAETINRQMMDRMEALESDFAGRLRKVEWEVTQVKEAVSSSRQGKSPSVSVIEQPATKKTVNEAGEGSRPTKVPLAAGMKKGRKKKDLKSDDFVVSLKEVNLTQSSEIDLQLSTQDFLESCVKNLSQDTFVKGFDLSQTQADDPLECQSPGTSLKLSTPQLCDKEIAKAGEAEADRNLVFVAEEDFEKLTIWQNSRTDIQVGPSLLNWEMADRIMSSGKWIFNHEIDAMMYIFRERTTLRRWKPDRVGLMTCVFSDLISKEYKLFLKGKRQYKMDKLLLDYGKGELPSHGRTQMLWSVDVDRIYVPVWVNRNHWIALCISFVNRHIDVFDCGGKQRHKEVEAFAHLIPRVVKAVQSMQIQKDLVITPYSVSYVPMRGLNKSGNHCGVYVVKHIECHLLGMKLSLLSDDNIKYARVRMLWDLWEAASDPEFIERMSKYEPPKSELSKCVELE